MKCCHCNNQILQEDIKQNKAHQLLGIFSHIKCDEVYLDRQEKLIKYHKNHFIEIEEI